MIKYIEVIALAFVLTELSNIITWRSKVKPINFILNHLNCLKCASFWLSLFIVGDIYTASITALTAYLIDKYIL